MPTPNALHELPSQIAGWARELGFADAGVSALPLTEDLQQLQRWGL